MQSVELGREGAWLSVVKLRAILVCKVLDELNQVILVDSESDRALHICATGASRTRITILCF